MTTALSDCEGFQVDSPDGRVGFVERILFEDPDTDDAPAALVVRVGLFGRNTLRTPLERRLARLARRLPLLGVGLTVTLAVMRIARRRR